MFRSSALIILGIVLILGSIAGSLNVLNSDFGALLPFSIHADKAEKEVFTPFAEPLLTGPKQNAPSLEDLLPTSEREEFFPDETFVDNKVSGQQPSEINAVVVGEVPERLLIPAIDLDAPVIAAEQQSIELDGSLYDEWLAPDSFATGWHTNSARLGESGNVVLNGHHNVYGKVFGKLIDLQVGDEITVLGANNSYRYVVTNMMIMPEKKVGADIRLDNARWIQPSSDSRLTLVTCWPATSNTHRLIIVAKEAGASEPIRDVE